MVDLDKVTDIYTHGGVFHTDDVMSTVLLKELKSDAKVHRVFEVPGNARRSTALVYDIGEGSLIIIRKTSNSIATEINIAHSVYYGESLAGKS